MDRYVATNLDIFRGINGGHSVATNLNIPGGVEGGDPDNVSGAVAEAPDAVLGEAARHGGGHHGKGGGVGPPILDGEAGERTAVGLEAVQQDRDGPRPTHHQGGGTRHTRHWK